MIETALTLIICLIPSITIIGTDYKDRIVNDYITIPITIFGFFNAVLISGDIKSKLIGFAFGFGIMIIVGLLGGVGGGDIKLTGALGIWFGFKGVLSIILISSLAGIIFGIYRLIKNRELKTELQGTYQKFSLFIISKGRINIEREVELNKTIPYGSFIVMGAWVYFIINLV